VEVPRHEVLPVVWSWAPRWKVVREKVTIVGPLDASIDMAQRGELSGPNWMLGTAELLGKDLKGYGAAEVYRRHRDEVGAVLVDLGMPGMKREETRTALATP
jgi:hypothetical protein